MNFSTFVYDTRSSRLDIEWIAAFHSSREQRSANKGSYVKEKGYLLINTNIAINGIYFIIMALPCIV